MRPTKRSAVSEATLSCERGVGRLRGRNAARDRDVSFTIERGQSSASSATGAGKSSWSIAARQLPTTNGEGADHGVAIEGRERAWRGRSSTSTRTLSTRVIAPQHAFGIPTARSTRRTRAAVTKRGRRLVRGSRRARDHRRRESTGCRAASCSASPSRRAVSRSAGDVLTKRGRARTRPSAKSPRRSRACTAPHRHPIASLSR